jgi:hypothetical protein
MSQGASKRVAPVPKKFEEVGSLATDEMMPLDVSFNGRSVLQRESKYAAVS